MFNLNDDKKLCITADEAAEVCGVCRNTMNKLIHRRGFPKIIVGRRILIPKEAFIKYINEVGVGLGD